MNKVILLDMDGVIADFVGAIFKAHGQLPNYGTWPPGEYDCSKVLGISKSDLWRTADKDPDFWRNMPVLENGFKLYEALKTTREIFIATSPSLDPNCAAGKVEWLQKYFGRNFRNYIITPHKYLMAEAGILIDDDDERCEKFRRAGGTAIVYPQPWNSKHEYTDCQLEYTLDVLRPSITTLGFRM